MTMSRRLSCTSPIAYTLEEEPVSLVELFTMDSSSAPVKDSSRLFDLDALVAMCWLSLPMAELSDSNDTYTAT